MSPDRTIYKWLCDLPEDYRIRALANVCDARLNLLESNIASALSNAFQWDATPEGQDFWSDVHDVLLGTKLHYPPLPTLPEVMKKFKLSDCPQDEQGRWLAVDSDGDNILLYSDKGMDPDAPFVGEYNDGYNWNAHQWSANDLSPAKKTVKKYLYLLEDGSVRVNSRKLPDDQSYMCYLQIVSRSEVEFDVTIKDKQ